MNGNCPDLPSIGSVQSVSLGTVVTRPSGSAPEVCAPSPDRKLIDEVVTLCDLAWTRIFVSRPDLGQSVGEVVARSGVLPSELIRTSKWVTRMFRNGRFHYIQSWRSILANGRIWVSTCSAKFVLLSPSFSVEEFFRRGGDCWDMFVRVQLYTSKWAQNRFQRREHFAVLNRSKGPVIFQQWFAWRIDAYHARLPSLHRPHGIWI